MASVRKREWEYNGVKKTAWVVEYTDPATGGRKRFTPKNGLKKDADKERLRIENEIERGMHTPAAEAISVSRMMEDFMRHCEFRQKDGQIGRSDHKRHKSHTDVHIKPRLGKMMTNEVTDAVMDEWYSDMRRVGRKPNTIKLIFCTLRMAEKHAKKIGRVKHVTIGDAIRSVAIAPVEPIKTFRKDEVVKLLAAPRLARAWKTDLRLRCFVHIAACCGLRFGEIAGLTIDHMDLHNRLIRVRHNLTEWGELKGPKTKAGLRDVPMPLNVHKLLVEWMERFYVPNDLNLVFLSELNTPLKASPFWGSYKRALLSVGLDKHLHFHALRHFAASWMVHNNLPLTDVANMLGHDKFDITLQVYAHPIADQQYRRAAIDKMTAGLIGVSE